KGRELERKRCGGDQEFDARIHELENVSGEVGVLREVTLVDDGNDLPPVGLRVLDEGIKRYGCLAILTEPEIPGRAPRFNELLPIDKKHVVLSELATRGDLVSIVEAGNAAV